MRWKRERREDGVRGDLRRTACARPCVISPSPLLTPLPFLLLVVSSHEEHTQGPEMATEEEEDEANVSAVNRKGKRRKVAVDPTSYGAKVCTRKRRKRRKKRTRRRASERRTFIHSPT